ncbi:bifunctional diguanylate cyclase/phosphodiesterase [Azospirillum rugosum]|uniref:Diguanylate cyclase (GGDEF)-like protein n=1 Tax=Azospirillum rugosum TaxID=416170 RepID=A0ABS4SVT9_9PROT|nr:bifunctional diguanylate cyclase/phosphodiesterase [Azospirillum rugosum]MBP2296676.1 diguanylate cyclase (GGDEF)-like protein [Azospirillum rugosum]MDQ0530265.1 diguanylate cyclase (GGDEF)-like protein [Azospirillum rugosum]
MTWLSLDAKDSREFQSHGLQFHGRAIPPGCAPGPVLPSDWSRVLDRLDYAFQPIVQMRSGRCHGMEALLRGVDRTPFADPHELLDAACVQGVLAEVECALHAKAVEAFRALDGWQAAKLFLNIDSRVVGTPGSPWLGLPADRRLNVSLEISERRELRPDSTIEQAIERYRHAGVGVALDDFGVGYAGLRLLYESKPDYVKIDRYFVAGIDQDTRKRAIATALVSYAHALGILIIAEGVETEKEFYTCRDLGCDFAQGYLIARPALGLRAIPERYDLIEDLNRKDRRKPSDVHLRLSEVIERQPPLPVTSPKTELLEYFRGNNSPTIAPIVDNQRRPLGLIRERDLKRYVYSRFGGELLRNKGLGDTLMELVVKSPVCDISTPLDQVIGAFSAEEATDGIIIVEGGEYVGFLSSGALIRLVHEHNLAMAADQNPLTRLPGNAAIVRHIEQALEDQERRHVLAYLDFDNFKPFNDTFGFRQGDRAILMFAERLKAWASCDGGFAGHIGGDDFFVAVSGTGEEEALAHVAELVAVFRSDAESLYDPAAREAGSFPAKDRYGAMREFPLLSASGVVVVVEPGPHRLTPDTVNAAIAESKALAKGSKEKLFVVRLG